MLITCPIFFAGVTFRLVLYRNPKNNQTHSQLRMAAMTWSDTACLSSHLHKYRDATHRLPHAGNSIYRDAVVMLWRLVLLMRHKRMHTRRISTGAGRYPLMQPPDPRRSHGSCRAATQACC